MIGKLVAAGAKWWKVDSWFRVFPSLNGCGFCVKGNEAFVVARGDCWTNKSFIDSNKLVVAVIDVGFSSKWCDR